MARLYDWEAFLTASERVMLENLDILVFHAKEELASRQSHRDSIRRKAVQRARNALNKKARAALERQS